jgi:hypothetical protein
MAQVGCPDRRIDRHCITCCSPSQPLRRAGMTGTISLSRERRRFLVALAPGHHCPAILRACWPMAATLVGRRANNPVSQERWPVAMDLGIVARASMVGGTVRPSAFAVSSNLVDCTTVRSWGRALHPQRGPTPSWCVSKRADLGGDHMAPSGRC